jgi:hypothetical protein
MQVCIFQTNKSNSLKFKSTTKANFSYKSQLISSIILITYQTRRQKKDLNTKYHHTMALETNFLALFITMLLVTGGESRHLLEDHEAPPVHSDTSTLPEPTSVPKVEHPPLPEIPKDTLPPKPELPKVEVPLLPEIPKDTLPPKPEIPKVELPPLLEIPKDTLPPKPEIPKVEVPPLPEIPKDTLPPKPEMPKVEHPPLPEIPKVTLPPKPEIPTSIPVIPKTPIPEGIPKLPIPFAPPHAKESP